MQAFTPSKNEQKNVCSVHEKRVLGTAFPILHNSESIQGGNPSYHLISIRVQLYEHFLIIQGVFETGDRMRSGFD